MANQVDYRDPTPNNFPDDYDESKVDPRVKLRSKSINGKMNGADVRGALAQGLEIAGVVASEAKKTAAETAVRQNSVEKSQLDFVNRYNKQISGNTDLKEVIDARGSDVTLGQRLDNIEDQPVALDQNILLDGPLSDKAKLDNLQAGVDANLFNLIFITDVHYGKWGAAPEKLNNTTIRHLNSALYLDDSVDTIISGGDNIDGWTLSLSGLLNEQLEYANKFLFGSGDHADKFIIKGNHDDGSGRFLQYQQGELDYLKWFNGVLGYSSAAPMLISDDQIKSSYHTGDLLFGERRDGDSLYFYKDYPNKKVRLIGLNSNDDPETLDEVGNPKYFGIQHMGYQQKQLEWLASVALQNIPVDYTTIIVGHIPATATGEDENNQECVNDIINAFQNGQAIHVISKTNQDWAIDLQADFSAQGPREMAGYINGHLHAEFLTTDLGFNSISVTSSIGTDDDQRDGWSLISLDTINRKLSIKGFGRATDREASY